MKIIDLSSDLAWQGNYFLSFLPLVAVTMLRSSSSKISSIIFGVLDKPLVDMVEGRWRSIKANIDRLCIQLTKAVHKAIQY